MRPLVTTCFGLLLAVHPVHAQQRPNVLFIAIDDLVTTIGPYGDTLAITPAMDTLASQGTTLRNHHCQWPVCGPSRAALTTSLLPEETGVMGFKPIRALLPDVITLPQHFRNNGYETAATGKFHDPRTVGVIVDPNSPTEDGRLIDDPASWSIPYVPGDAGYSPAGNPAVDAADRPDSDYVDFKILTEGKGLLDIISAGNKPFFLAVGFKKPHLPFVAPKKYWDMYDRDQFSPAPFQDLPFNCSTFIDATLSDNDELLGYEPYDVTGLPTPEQQKELQHGYYACVTFIDTLVGGLLDYLAAKNDPVQPGKKMSETTIIVLWGDHGFHLGDHGKWAKHDIMERGSAAPLIIHDPRNPAGGVQNFHPVDSIDIYPTLCELAGLPVPEQPLNATVTTGRPVRGRSIVPMLHDAGASVNAGALTYISKNSSIGYAYRTDRYRYIEWVNGSNVVLARELYDYQADPLETRNAIGDPRNAALAWQFSRSMRAETYSKGALRLQASAPLPASGGEISLGEGYLSGVTIRPGPSAGAPSIELGWTGARGVTYDILTSATLEAGSWSANPDGINGSAVTLPLDGPRAFYLVTLGTNTPPSFASDPLLFPDATAGQAYAESLASLASDTDAGDTLSFALLDGPGWLSVGSGGTLSGAPATGDIGTHFGRVQVADSHGATETATFCLQVVTGGPPTETSSFTATDDTYAKLSDTPLVPGSQNVLEMRKDGASGFTRITYLKFTVSGVGTVQSATLHLHSNTETDPVVAHSVADTAWSEGTLNWDNHPAYGAALGSATPAAGAWFSIDVSAAVTGNGTFAFALDEQGNTVGRLDSKEAGFVPYLEVEWTP